MAPRLLPAPLQAHMLVYRRWPFCWFCSLVLARSMGNTQVTPISPAMPPLMSLAGRLCGQRECQDDLLGHRSAGRGGQGWGGAGWGSDLICLSAI